MDGRQFNEMYADTFNKVAMELRKTNVRYGSANNVLENLSITASLLDLDPRRAHTAAITKHLVALIGMGKTPEVREPYEWDELITKLLVDIMLLKAVVVEEHNALTIIQELKQP